MLGAFRREAVNVDGEEVWLWELSTEETFSIWDALNKADGKNLDVYLDVVRLGLRDAEGQPLFEDEIDRAELARMPARIVVPLAERILALSEIETETPRGNV